MKISEIVNSIQSELYSAFFFSPPIYRRESFLFTKPEHVIWVSDPSELGQAYIEIDELIKYKKHGYGIIPYETGYLFEKKLETKWKPLKKSPVLLYCFFNDKNIEAIRYDDIEFDNSFQKPFKITDFGLNISKSNYANNVKKIKKYIEQGDTYQVNYTAKGKFEFSGDMSSLFQSLVFNQSANYTALINLPEKFIISVSPELFFKQEGNQIITKPMKGTITRGYNLQRDMQNKIELKNGSKNKAENLMIVDLLRNDLGKLSIYNSVETNKLYSIEKYESLFQMVSVIKSTLENKVNHSDIIKSMFPCGSVTGTPKIRTMEIINELEKEPRNIYTGSIGLITGKESVFNVAIRTLVLDKKGKGEIGIGSGIVWDSDADKEYDEVLLKANFLLKPENYFELYETMLVENGKVFLFEEHLDRLKSAANYFLFLYNGKKILNQLNEILQTTDKRKKYRIKLTLEKFGYIKIELNEFNEVTKDVIVSISKRRTTSENKFLYFKTTNRKRYADELKKYSAKGCWDVLFFNERNELTEGARTNIFIKKGKEWFTPPLSTGLLNGVYRKHLLETKNNYHEAILYKKDLQEADEVILTNALRKIISVKEVIY